MLRDGLEALFVNNSVDLVIQAHRHNYQVTWPTAFGTNTSLDYVAPTAPVYIVNGAAGVRILLRPSVLSAWSCCPGQSGDRLGSRPCVQSS